MKEELLKKAEQWQLAIERMQMWDAKNFISEFQAEFPDSDTIRNLSVQINSFINMPSIFNYRHMKELSKRMVIEVKEFLERENAKRQQTLPI